MNLKIKYFIIIVYNENDFSGYFKGRQHTQALNLTEDVSRWLNNYAISFPETNYWLLGTTGGQCRPSGSLPRLLYFLSPCGVTSWLNRPCDANLFGPSRATTKWFCAACSGPTWHLPKPGIYPWSPRRVINGITELWVSVTEKGHILWSELRNTLI